MPRTLWLVPALFLVAGTVPAQEPDPPAKTGALHQGRVEAERQLASEQPAQAAWGAYLVGRLELAELTPILRRELGEWTASQHDQAPRVRLFLLDALARLGAELPGEELAPHLEGLSLRPALVLAAANPRTHGALLFALLQRFWKEGDTNVRLAAGNLLTGVRHPRYAAWLMQRLELTLHVTVRDEAPSMIGVGTGGAGGAFGGRSVGLGDSWPPVPRYRLSTQGAHGSVLLAPGPTPVYYTRTENPNRILVIAQRCPSHNPVPTIHQWLGAMARHDLDRLGVPLLRAEVVYFKDADTYRNLVTEWRDAFAKGHAELTRSLVLQGAMTDAEAEALTLPLRIRILDERRNNGIPLPDIG